MSDAMNPRDLGLTYEQALHGMQSATRYAMNRADTGTEAKHLRVGIDSAMSAHAALVRLLVNAGVVDLDEYLEAVRLQANEEVALAEDQFGGKVKFR